MFDEKAVSAAPGRVAELHTCNEKKSSQVKSSQVKNETERGVLCWCAAQLQTIDPRSIDLHFSRMSLSMTPSLTKIPASRCTLDAAR